jgi:putative tricarboxylic transport membrane protein
VKRGSQLAALCLLALFAVAGVAALDFALLDDLGPGPGFFPFWLALVGAALAIVLLIEVSRTAAGEPDGPAILPDRPGGARGLVVLASLVAAAALLEPLGYRLTMLLFLAGLLVALGVRSPAGIAATALLGSFGVFHVFYHWLKVPLPIGQLGI